MKVLFFVLAACGLAAAAPQNWPYRDSLMPYRYGYPSQTQYKYLPQIEDDEDVGPYLAPSKARHDAAMSRQDVAVGTDGDRVRPTPEASVPGVVETGSVAPVVEPTKAPVPVQPTRVPGPPAPRPIVPDGGNRPVQPPVFPPARPPPTPAPVEPEEDEEDDESDEEADADPEADDENDGDDAGDDEEQSPDDDDNEEEEEEERRRQVPLNSDETVEVAPVVPVPVVDKPVVVANPPAPVVVAPVNKTQAPAVVSESSVEDVNPAQAVESNEVGQPDSDDDSSEEQGLGDGVEALVPGYVTEQGEVLVPVDTVSGDQPISIVPDPYSPLARGIPIRGSHAFQSDFDDIAYSNPYYFSEEPEPYDGVGRQDDSEESAEEPEGRNEFLTDFPPARTPELYELISQRVSAQQAYFAGQYQQQPQRYQQNRYQQQRYQQEPYQQQRYQQQPYQQQRYQQQPYQQQPYQQQPYQQQPYQQQPYQQQPYQQYRYQQQPYQQERFQQNRYQGPYAYQGAPIIYQVRPQRNNPSVSLAIRVNGGNGNNNNFNPYVNRFVAQPQYVHQEQEYYPGAEPVLRGPYSPVYNRPQNRPYTPYNPYVGYRNRPQYAPVPRPFYPGPSAFGPQSVPLYGGPGTFRPGYNTPRPIRPVHRPQSTYSEGLVYIKRRPIAASIAPVNLKTKRPQPIQAVEYSKYAPSKRRPAPADYQDDEFPYPFVNPFPSGYNKPVPVADANTSASESVEEQPKKVVPVANKAPVEPAKARRAPKMAKKNLQKKPKVTDSDPLNILKKVSKKRN